jgi:hypothetical protein
MSRCFSNNNITSIKSSKEYIENKRNDAFFCNYANTAHWKKNDISDENLKVVKKNIFTLNHYNKITKANNHSNYLNLSKGLFNRKLLIHKSQIEETNVWKKKQLLDKLTSRKLLTLMESENNDDYKKKCKENNDDYVQYGPQAAKQKLGNYGLNYLTISNKNVDASHFSTFTENLATNKNLMNKPLKKITPFCFNLHGNNYIKYPQSTSNNYGVGFEMFGDFKKTVAHPRKSIKQSELKLLGIGKGSNNSNWQFDKERAYFWGGSGTLSYPRWKYNDYLKIDGIADTSKWSLVMDVKFKSVEGADSVVGNITNNNPTLAAIATNITDAQTRIDELIGDDEKAAKQEAENLKADWTNVETSAKEKSTFLFRSQKTKALKSLDQGIRIRDGYIRFADLSYNKVDVNGTLKSVERIKKGHWYTFAFVFNNQDNNKQLSDRVNIWIRKETDKLNDQNWEKLVPEDNATLNEAKLTNILSIGGYIELFKENYTDKKNEILTNTPLIKSYWGRRWIESGYVKNVYFTTENFTLNNIKKIKEFEYNPI